jgi:hypothetical protein
MLLQIVPVQVEGFLASWPGSRSSLVFAQRLVVAVSDTDLSYRLFQRVWIPQRDPITHILAIPPGAKLITNALR